MTPCAIICLPPTSIRVTEGIYTHKQKLPIAQRTHPPVNTLIAAPGHHTSTRRPSLLTRALYWLDMSPCMTFHTTIPRPTRILRAVLAAKE